MSTDISGHFASTCRKPNQDNFLQIQLFQERGKIVGIRVHVVAFRGLAGAPVTATVVRDTTESLRGEEEHLCLPAIRRQWPSVAEDNRPSGAPVFIVDL